jgi:glycosyltransferase involved in cell wall biosynthesis
MVSILIPVYNYSIIGLGKELMEQGIKLKHPFEIIFLDDASSDKNISKSNQSFCEENQITYIISDKNRGRVGSRNFLATQAKYQWLLFMDSDVFPVNKNFLKLYISCISETLSVCSGNIKYRRIIPEAQQKLRWKYGLRYEDIAMEKRMKNKYLHAKSANLFIKKEVFFQTEFPLLQYDYGFEDTLFGLILESKEIDLKLLENPVYHDGLEENRIFLDKAKESIRNLAYLINNKNPLSKGIRLVRVYHKLKKAGMTKFVKYFFVLNKNRISKNLLSGNPNIQLFQLYKLGYLCELLA